MKASAILLAFLLLAACKSVTSGIVTERQQEAAYSYITMNCAYYKTTGGCGAYVPEAINVPASWTLCLRDNTEDKPVKDQSTGCVDVSPDDWSRYRVGDRYP
jgi:hypothetical protein